MILLKFFRYSMLVSTCLMFVINLNAQDQQQTYAEKQTVIEWLDRPEVISGFGEISDAIWSYAELGFQEFKSSDLLIETLEKEGFAIERGLAGMPTCFTATYGSGKPVIGILTEFDALPMISQQGRNPVRAPVLKGAPGHGCGHNLMGTASIAAAIAIKKSMEKHNITGIVKVFGSPAEEILASRPYMVRAGLFDGIDAVIDNHFSSGFSTSYGVGNSALFSVIYTFRGVTAHSAGSPWTGRSALDAVEIMNVATNYLREHLHFGHRLHYIITDGGEAPNVVPDLARVWYFIRNSDDMIEEMIQRVNDCARGAALAAGVTLSEIKVLTAIHQLHPNKAAAELFQRNIELVGMPRWSDEEHAFARALQKELGKKENGFPLKHDTLQVPSGIFTGGGSSDVGEVTLIAPTATIRFPGGVPGATGHHWSTVACTWGSAAHKGMISGAKAIAASAIDLLTKPGELKNLRDEFETNKQKNPYKSFLPDDAVPPVDINKVLMDKWRQEMTRYYSDH